MRLSKFLKKHKAYKQFKKNFDIDFKVYKEGDTIFINWAFAWSETNEGFDFWNNIDDLWWLNKKKKYDLIVKNNKLKKIKGY
jgi:hypothetical protein